MAEAKPNAFRAILQHAKDLSIPVPREHCAYGTQNSWDSARAGENLVSSDVSGSRDGATPQVSVLQLREAEREVVRLYGALTAAVDMERSASLIDPSILAQREVALRSATTVLEQVVSHSSTLAQRLKDVNAKPTLPVEVGQQAAFAALLRTAAQDVGGGGRLAAEVADSAGWAAGFTEVPHHAWEPHLAPLALLAGALQAQLAALDRLRRAGDALLAKAEASN
jgi:hypothetical protein